MIKLLFLQSLSSCRICTHPTRPWANVCLSKAPTTLPGSWPLSPGSSHKLCRTSCHMSWTSLLPATSSDHLVTMWHHPALGWCLFIFVFPVPNTGPAVGRLNKWPQLSLSFLGGGHKCLLNWIPVFLRTMGSIYFSRVVMFWILEALAGWWQWKLTFVQKFTFTSLFHKLYLIIFPITLGRKQVRIDVLNSYSMPGSELDGFEPLSFLNYTSVLWDRYYCNYFTETRVIP